MLFKKIKEIQLLDNNNLINFSSHLQFNNYSISGTVLNYVKRTEVLINVNESKVIQYYSRY